MIRIGIAGLGRLGQIHLEHLNALEGFSISGVYDIDPVRAAEAAGRFNLPLCTSYRELLEGCGAVLIATPTSSHFKYAEAALKRGRHVFIEKPIAERTTSARKLMELAREAGVLIQVGHVERYNPAFCAIKNRRLDPRFIEAHRLAPFDQRGTDVSVVLDLMIHDIDLVLSIVPSNVRRIQASGVPVITGNIDIANARLEFDNGAVANLTASRISLKRMRKMRIFQHREYIGVDLLEKKVDIISLDDLHDGLAHNGASNGRAWGGIRAESPPVKDTNAIREELKAFRQSILTGQEPEVNAIQASRALELADHIIHKIGKNYQLSE